MSVRHASPVCALILALTAAAPAFAVDGTITINGEIVDSTCKINGKAPPADFVVHLPKISTSALKMVGDVAGATPFEIKLTDCPSTLSGEVKAYFEPGATTDYDSGNLRAYSNTSDSSSTDIASSIPSTSTLTLAQNVQIQLANPDSSKITLGAGANSAAGAMLTGDGMKSATLRYLARYVKSGADTIKAGKLVSYVQYSIVYP
ncbi:fimbrial protein [Bordetella trematum]|uniref:fimbrial protein n=1 Tax=Bordetella trematum TaxID=123899 RepID=UPI0015C56440|nr:fimbrial protein [Bordetella trematum]